MESLVAGIGRALRRARLSRGLTLREVSTASGGRFKATSVAGYERGERHITLQRFCELCRFYDVPPEELLTEIVRSGERPAEPEIDLAVLELLDPEQRALVSSFVRQIRALRRERGDDMIVLRAGDLEVLATASGKEPEELRGMLRPTHRRED
jgi:transcriptional regulator with XRE-family HTH domain